MHSAWEASKRFMSVFSVLLPDFPEVNLVQVLRPYCTGLHRESEMPVMFIIRFQTNFQASYSQSTIGSKYYYWNTLGKCDRNNYSVLVFLYVE